MLGPVDAPRAARFIRSSLVLLLLLIGAGTTGAAEPVTVELLSGRTFTGRIDARTDDQRLWLRFDEGAASIVRPIAWQRVIAVEYGPERFDAERARQLVKELATAAPDRPRPSDSPEGASPRVPVVASDAYPPHASGTIGSLQVDAYVADWGPGVEVDGLVVHVYPLSTRGELLPVRGTLTFELIGVRPRTSSPVDRYPVVGRWTRTLHPGDVGPDGAVYRLEFQAVHPEFTENLRAHGLLRARLAAPGHGTFETSADFLRIRPYSPVRDDLQLQRGERFHPRERTRRTR